ncbi:hypothetical protein ACWD4G_26510 [Streptomyces sp. NPDC002643]
MGEDEWPPLGQFLSGPRLHGCLWAMAALCAWPLVVGLLAGYPPARSARRPARRIFTSRGRGRIWPAVRGGFNTAEVNAALLSGPASVTAVAYWEINRPRTRHGVVLRD